ncbi:hypothetical protein L226DRAFT_535876 [Lentinus tigrinus ALCF2SS1-7]|uniref:Uncharacterized protein n=1 Tax=Lentinus tigrinus ALCF2SS1-6 TaxID=1328759 RepID=A0A5C2RYL5_9APHY|nr:hypothetical protein L227DRAFT_579116 [Lentinus tigrinus ALCF2SS1-6]RPD73978.1 hypothetical protein L226DRAFT_535876 [Lentinus tigrinus ALCF2SS1-7]
MSSGSQHDTLTSRLSSTFWLLLNTPMIPPEEKAESKAVQMVDFSDSHSRGAHSRGTSRSSMDSHVTQSSDASENST